MHVQTPHIYLNDDKLFITIATAMIAFEQSDTD